MTPADIGAKVLGLALPMQTARRLAPLGLAVAALLLLGLAWGAWQAFDWFNDRDAVEDAANKANADFGEDLNTVTGEADTASAERRAEHDRKIRTTEELIDEATEKNCAIVEYLASGGDRCVRPPVAVPGAGSQ